MAAANNAVLDPLQALSAALAVPANSPEQAALLTSLRDTLEKQQDRIPILCTALITTISGAGDSLLKRWVLNLLHFGLARSSLSIEKRTQLAAQSLDVLAGVLHDPSSATLKIVIQCFATVYPLLFRLYCSNRSLRQQWETLSKAKSQILDLTWNEHTATGIRLVAQKFTQRVILVQTRGFSDPRLQNKADPNLALCPSDHPFISASQLEMESTKLLERVIALFFGSRNVNILSAIVNSWSSLAKLRPALVPVIITALGTWHPRHLEGLPASSVKSVEKVIRILLIHISRGPNGAGHAHQIQEALQKQVVRMEQAVHDEKNRREAAASETNRKRQLSNTDIGQGQGQADVKRVKLEHPSNTSDPLADFLANFDFSALPVGLVADLVIANLQLLSEQVLNSAIETFRQTHPRVMPTVVPATAPATTSVQATAYSATSVAPIPSVPSIPGTAPSLIIKEEPIDPLQMDIDEDDIEYEPDRLNDQLEVHSYAPFYFHILIMHDQPLTLVNFQLPPPRRLSDADREVVVRHAITRIRVGAEELVPSVEIPGQKAHVGLPPSDMWMLLLVRMVTRVSGYSRLDDEAGLKAEVVEKLVDRRNQDTRETLYNYVIEDFCARTRLATLWLNEEWYNDRIRRKLDSNWEPQYEIWLQKIMEAHGEQPNAKDRTFSQFLLDLPYLPDSILAILREFCTDPERTQIGFLTLREFVALRPPLRAQAVEILLELTTHPSKAIRTPAINTVKRWVPDMQPMDGLVRTFSLRLLRRLQKRTLSDIKPGQAETSDEDVEDGQLPQEEILQTMYLPEEITLPADKAQVLQHVELTFALSVRVPDLLDEIFAAYGQMDTSVQEAIQDLITALIRSLGPTHGKLLTLLRTFPPGAETLALRVLTIFTDGGRPSSTIVALVKSLITERDLDARFLIPIIAEMDKADILRHLPRIVSMLNGQPEPKNLVRSVFGAIVTTPPQTFGSVTSNLPRVRQSELLTPAELMVVLHESEKEIGLNSAKEAISICFSMTDVFRSEILAVVMQQIMDEPVIPTLFMRTVIQSVQTYKSLVGFVSTTLLSRLITKKIWTNESLWKGFIHCAKAIAPASFGALLQLPKDQLREIVDKQPGLKTGLREFLIKKAAGNKARVANYLEIFGDGEKPPTPMDVSPPPA
ncbi:Symplekin tight junction protein C terminal-domain-containing protein [Hysterangium stoloniferum]|nr:Symplekin tight junction protein C terminal-domain-containing protein [Hysterangium stoloniferum]